MVGIEKLETKYVLSKNVFKPGKDGEKPEFVKIFATVKVNGKVTIQPMKGGRNFFFQDSDPLLALSVAELIAEAAALAAKEAGELDQND